MSNFPWEDDIPDPEYDFPESLKPAPKLELVKPPETPKKILVDMDQVLERCKNYPLMEALITYHSSQGIKRIDSFVLGVSITSLSYLYSHSYEVGQEKISRKMSLNTFVAIVANTGFEKTGYLGDCKNEIINRINNVIHEKFQMDKNFFSSTLPASFEGLQAICRQMPSRIFVLDEAKQYLKLKENSPKYHAFEGIRNLFDPFIFGLSSTKKSENDNKATDRSIATMLIAGTTADMKKYLLSDEKLEDGTANRYIVIGPSSTRTGSKRAIRIEKQFLEDACFEIIRKKSEQHIIYEKDKFVDGTEIARRIVKYVYSPEIEEYFQKIGEENDRILDEYDEKGMEVEPKVIMLTRQVVIKKRLAYILWLDCERKNPQQCAKDADDIINVLNKTTESLLQDTKVNSDIVRKKILSLRDKAKPDEIIYLSKLTGKNGMLDVRIYKDVLIDLEKFLRSLSALDQIVISERGKSICSFKFTNPS